jgi:hypothetical protein
MPFRHRLTAGLGLSARPVSGFVSPDYNATSTTFLHRLSCLPAPFFLLLMLFNTKKTILHDFVTTFAAAI